MVDYKNMYLLLFNSITDAVKDVSEHNYEFARLTLLEVQRKAEEMFIDTEEEAE